MAEMKMVLTCVVLLMMVASSASVKPTVQECVEVKMKFARMETKDPEKLAGYQKTNEEFCANWVNGL